MEVEGTKEVVIALFQGKAKNGDVRVNLDQMKKQVVRAAGADAQLHLFPELFLSGYNVHAEEMKKLAEERDGASFKELSKTAKELNIAILYGYPEVDRSSGAPIFYNSAQLIDRDGVSLVNYRKTHIWMCPDPPQYEAGFTAGSRFEDPVECCGLKIGILICHDFSFSETVRSLALSGANFIAVPTASSTKYNRRCTNFIAPARALDNGVYVAVANNVGVGYDGCSQVCDPNGRIIAYCGSESQEALMLARLSLPVSPMINYVRMRIPELYKV